MLSIFSIEDALRIKSAQCFLSFIFNTALYRIKMLDRDRQAALYTSKHSLVTSYMENGNGRLKFAWRYGALDIRVVKIIPRIDVDNDKKAAVSTYG